LKQSPHYSSLINIRQQCLCFRGYGYVSVIAQSTPSLDHHSSGARAAPSSLQPLIPLRPPTTRNTRTHKLIFHPWLMHSVLALTLIATIFFISATGSSGFRSQSQRRIESLRRSWQNFGECGYDRRCGERESASYGAFSVDNVPGVDACWRIGWLESVVPPLAGLPSKVCAAHSGVRD
jgi:hypothetical protein